MFSKNEHETERHPIGFIQEEDGKKYLGKDNLYLMTNETDSSPRGCFRTLSEKELTDSLSVKYLKRGGAGSPSVFDLTFVNYQFHSSDQVVLSSNTPRSSI